MDKSTNGNDRRDPDWKYQKTPEKAKRGHRGGGVIGAEHHVYHPLPLRLSPSDTQTTEEIAFTTSHSKGNQTPFSIDRILRRYASTFTNLIRDY